MRHKECAIDAEDNFVHHIVDFAIIVVRCLQNSLDFIPVDRETMII